MTPIILIIFVIGLYVGNRLQDWVTSLVKRIEKYRLFSIITPTPVDDYKLCQGRHTWIDANTLDENNEVVKINVCDVCGFIPSKNLMATQEGLKRIRENKKLNDLEEKIKKEFIDIEEAGLKEFFSEELKNGLNFDKIAQVYSYGQTLRNRLILYKIARAEKELKQDPQGDVDERRKET